MACRRFAVTATQFEFDSESHWHRHLTGGPRDDSASDLQSAAEPVVSLPEKDTASGRLPQPASMPLDHRQLVLRQCWYNEVRLTYVVPVVVVLLVELFAQSAHARICRLPSAAASRNAQRIGWS